MVFSTGLRLFLKISLYKSFYQKLSLNIILHFGKDACWVKFKSARFSGSYIIDNYKFEIIIEYNLNECRRYEIDHHDAS